MGEVAAIRDRAMARVLSLGADWVGDGEPPENSLEIRVGGAVA
jgi:hypothetical protein